MACTHPGGWILLRRRLQEAAGARQAFHARTAKWAILFSKMSHFGLKRYDSVDNPLSMLGMKW